jgi:hypothetical protein
MYNQFQIFNLISFFIHGTALCKHGNNDSKSEPPQCAYQMSHLTNNYYPYKWVIIIPTT